MFYTVYKITNQVNGKIYIGVHKTDDLNDDYMGSGVRLKLAKEKYGIENFTREYLRVFDNAEDMFKMESELVNEEFVSRDDTYNLKVGGHGGWDACHRKYYTDPEFRKIHRQNSIRGGLSAASTRNPLGTFFNRSHSDETKAKMSEKAKLRTGEKNSSFGSMWIMNSETKESKKIKKDESIPEGWVKGRKQVK